MVRFRARRFFMKKLENFAVSLNVDELLLRPATDKIINFYKKLNYNYKYTGGDDSIIMGKELKRKNYLILYSEKLIKQD